MQKKNKEIFLGDEGMGMGKLWNELCGGAVNQKKKKTNNSVYILGGTDPRDRKLHIRNAHLNHQQMLKYSSLTL